MNFLKHNIYPSTDAVKIYAGIAMCLELKSDGLSDAEIYDFVNGVFRKMRKILAFFCRASTGKYFWTWISMCWGSASGISSSGTEYHGGVPKMENPGWYWSFAFRLPKGEAMRNMETTGNNIVSLTGGYFFRTRHRLGCITDKAPARLPGCEIRKHIDIGFKPVYGINTGAV